jgi:hypothetical protein
MPIRNVDSPKIDLNRNSTLPPLMVDLQKFFEFSFWMAEELLDLEARFRTRATQRRASASSFGMREKFVRGAD